MTTLAIHPGALGDVLLAVPALRALRAARGDGLVLAAQPRIGALLSALGVVDSHVPFEGLGLEALFVDEPGPAGVEALRAASHVVCWFAARDPVFVRRLAEDAPGAVVASAVGDGTRDVWEHLLATVDGVDERWREPSAVPAGMRADGRRALAGAGWDGTTPLVVVHAGAGGLAKRWPVEGFARVLTRLLAERPLAVALHQSPADADATSALSSRLPSSRLVLDGLSLVELAGALGHAAAWLGNDSGVSHLACAVGAPALVLFEGSKLAWRPWSVAARVEIVETASVAPGDVETVLAVMRDLLKDAA